MTRDPYRYFRVEARELVDALSKGALELERSGASREAVGALLRHAHTLKGAARVVKLAAIAELAHAIEDRLEPHREGGRPLEPELVNGLLRSIDAIAAELSRIDAPEPGAETRPRAEAPPRAETQPAPAPRKADTIHVPVALADQLLAGVAEVAVEVSGFVEHARTAERAARAGVALSRAIEGEAPRVRARWRELEGLIDELARDLGKAAERARRDVDAVLDRAQTLRLVSASEAFPALERAARDTAQALGKSVAFEATGGDVRLDAHVLDAVASALGHVVRNAVAHGIEAEAERARAGKPRAGRVAVDAARRGERVVFTCRDDGRGIDAEAVRRKAVERGLVSAAEAKELSRDATLALLRRGGVSTAPALSQVSGRGVGLSSVHETLTRVKGELFLTSDASGTTIELRVPVSLASVEAIVVEASGAVVALPLASVARTFRLDASEIARAAGKTSVLDGPESLVFRPLASLLGRDVPSPRAWSVVVVRSGGERAAIGVDRVRGTTREVVRSLPRACGRLPLVSGASLDTRGGPRLLLDPDQVVASARAATAALEREAARAPRAPILVVDDSLTTRMLEQSILESAGYTVELATSAEEALEKARARTYAAFVVDVEMPGMDGYAFVALTRRDPVLGRIPAILVTSRGSDEDRRRGADAGAHAYIVKGEFDQGRLLAAIAEVVE